MKRILIYSIATVGLLLSGCATSKRVHDTLQTATSATEQVDLRAESRETIESASHTETESTSAESEDARRIELEFDTTQPTDSATGLPPVRRITITDRRRNRTTDTHQQTSDTVKYQKEETLQDSTRRESQSEMVAERTTEKKSRPSSLPWLLVGIALVALGWAAWRKWGRG
ncbi:hypothetical protein [uncultured Rikenella sp.]|uniref:hypothetical protein n=1 Tax=uncultured Rikenella sp. TaxID=368003 RepID=UPI0025DC900C|nr:hypothetical protein [uncultured Rikenella sp.]